VDTGEWREGGWIWVSGWEGGWMWVSEWEGKWIRVGGKVDMGGQESG